MILEQIIQTLKDVEAGNVAARSYSEVLSGYSGEKIIALLQAVTAMRDPATECYLEVGVFQGMTLLSNAASNPSIECFGIDNFSQFDPGGHNLALVQDRQKRLGANNATLIVDDLECALMEGSANLKGKRAGVYFVDGPHDYRSQILCLLLARHYLSERCVIVIDDCNYAHVRQANADFLSASPEFRLLFEAYTPSHPENMDAADLASARRGWWNGINVLLHDPDHRLPRVSCSVSPSRDLFLQDHLVHAQRGADIAVDAVSFAESLLKPWTIPTAGARLIRRVAKKSGEMRRRYSSLNTYSSDLPRAKLIEPRA